MKIGLDIHGVIDKYPLIFKKLTEILENEGHEIHILTGININTDVKNELTSYGVIYDELFSIIDYHKNIGTHMWQDNKGYWWLDDDLWNKTKSIYCEENNIDLHIDDTRIYGKYFKKSFLHLKNINNIEILNNSNDEIVSYIIMKLNYIINEINQENLV